MPRNYADYRAQRILEGRPITDNRVNRHRTDKDRNRGDKSKWERRNIVAWDGEGANLSDGTHVYNLLANSLGHYIINHEGLSTEQCLNFMLRDSTRSAINVIYGGSYDVNMLLRDLPSDKIRDLWARGTTYWGPYCISYAHRKRFSVKLFDRESGKKRPIKSFILWDVLGYFQKSFVEACRAWLGKDISDAMPILDQIESMKGQRSTFSVDKIEDILAYNHAECKLLVLLVKALFDAMDEADIQLTRYDGAGSIAAALMRRANILSHGGSEERNDRDCPTIYQWAQYAYSGGRIEATKVGNLNSGNVFRYDINSAYPSAAITLPSLAGATYTIEPKWRGNDFSMVDVEWYYSKDAPFYPLWYREHDGSIIYPRQGRGRYWGYEARLLFDYFTEGVDFQVYEAYNIEPAIDAKPFDFIRHDYATRLRFAEQGNMASVAIKLGLNSIYGKLAQQAGYRNGRIPTYHNLLWAGAITSATRARMYRAAMQHPESVIAFATDAVISLKEHDVTCGKGLGEWTAETLEGITIVQAGVYWLKHNDEWYSKYRGFDKGSLVRDEILQCWETDEPYRAKLTRFYGMGSAIGLNNFTDYWRVWRTDERTLDLVPKGKRLPTIDTFYYERLCDTLPSINYTPDVMSTPYPILWGLLGDTILRDKDGDDIDIRIAEEEYLDSYA
jgi:hypothetical protein